MAWPDQWAPAPESDGVKLRSDCIPWMMVLTAFICTLPVIDYEYLPTSLINVTIISSSTVALVLFLRRLLSAPCLLGFYYQYEALRTMYWYKV